MVDLILGWLIGSWSGWLDRGAVGWILDRVIGSWDWSGGFGVEI